MKIVCLVGDDPFEKIYGGSIAVRTLWQSVSENHEVHMIATVKGSTTQTIRRVHNITVYRVPRSTVPIASIVLPYAVASRWNSAFDRILKEVLDAVRPDLVFAEGTAMAVPAVRVQRSYGLPVAVRFHNLEGRYFRQLAKASKRILAKLAYTTDGFRMVMLERRILEGVTVAFFVSLDEMKEVETFAPSPVLAWLPPIVTVRKRSVEARMPARNILLPGSLDLPNNQYAVQWFVKSVLPRIRAFIDDARVVIAGKGPGRQILSMDRLPGVTVVPDPVSMDPLYEECDVVVVPLLHGAGIKVRVLEAISWAKPVVGTSVAFEGSGLKAGEHVLVADDAKALADAVVHVLRAPNDFGAMVRRALTYVEHEFSVAGVLAKLEAAFRSIGLDV